MFLAMLAVWLYGWLCQSVGPTLGVRYLKDLTEIKFCTDIHDPQRMKPLRLWLFRDFSSSATMKSTF